MLTGIHFLLSYKCTFECDHCFVYSSPRAKGTFMLKNLKKVFNEIVKIKTIEWIYFEGGEPFLFYPLMLEGIKLARGLGYKVGVVTNAYFANSEEDAILWLKPIHDLGVSDLSISDDSFHNDKEKDSQAKTALAAAKKLNIPVSPICIDQGVVKDGKDMNHNKGMPVVGGSVMFKGRAVEKLSEGLPKRSWKEFTECPYEELTEPERVHIDPYGNVHLCQGISMGNIWETPLSVLIKNYNHDSHPICGPLVKGGPALLAEEYKIQHEDTYVDACHFCYLTRLALIDKYPQYLSPRQVYGLE